MLFTNVNLIIKPIKDRKKKSKIDYEFKCFEEENISEDENHNCDGTNLSSNNTTSSSAEIDLVEGLIEIKL